MAKKLLALVLCFALCAALVACTNGNQGSVEVTSELTGEKIKVKQVVEDTPTGAKANELNETDSWGGMKMRVAGYRKFNDDPLNYEFAKGAEEFTKKYGTTVEFEIGGKTCRLGGIAKGSGMIHPNIHSHPERI